MPLSSTAFTFWVSTWSGNNNRRKKVPKCRSFCAASNITPTKTHWNFVEGSLAFETNRGFVTHSVLPDDRSCFFLWMSLVWCWTRWHSFLQLENQCFLLEHLSPIKKKYVKYNYFYSGYCCCYCCCCCYYFYNLVKVLIIMLICLLSVHKKIFWSKKSQRGGMFVFVCVPMLLNHTWQFKFYTKIAISIFKDISSRKKIIGKIES